MNMVEKFIKNPEIIINIKKNELVKMIKTANETYFQSTPLISDELYEILFESLREKDPNHYLLNEIGASVSEKVRIKLPYFLPSSNKIKMDNKKLQKFISQYPPPYVMSDKEDGVSALLVCKNGVMKMYTRGNGEIGGDITNLVPHINDLNKLDLTQNFVVRGELIIPIKKFNIAQHCNARNAVSGVVNAKIPNEKILKTIDFVAYETIEPTHLTPSLQMKYLTENKFRVVEHQILQFMDIDLLSQLLAIRRKHSKYEIDGIIITHNEVYKRTKKNPSFIFAYKEDTIVFETTIEAIEYRVSKDGLLKPRARVKPIQFPGVTVTYVTLHNARYVVDNHLGVGAVILLVRSGDVIPYVLEVKKKAKTISMPQVPYRWNKTKIDLVFDGGDSSEMNRASMVYFCKQMEIAFISEGVVQKFIDHGINTIDKMLRLTIKDLLKIPTIKEKSAQKIFDSIQSKIHNVELHRIMVASNLFGSGLGIKKLQKIVNHYPDILKKTTNDLRKDILKLEGFDVKTVQKFVDGLEKFKLFLDNNPMIVIQKPKIKSKIKTTGRFQGKKIVLSGFRDKELESNIEENGGEVSSNVSRATDILIVKSKDQETSKTKKAKEYKVQILTKKEFLKL